MKKKSRHRNASAHEDSNSQDARSRNSVRKKSSQSKSDELSLRVATPQSHGLPSLIDGLVVPDEIPSDEDAVRLDFTRLSSRDLGNVHSRFAVRHAHAIFTLARRESALVTHRRNLRMAQAKFRQRHGGEFKNKYSLDDAMEQNKTIAAVLNEIALLEAERVVIEAVAQGYDDLRAAASREMFRRSSENAPKD